MSRLHGRGRVGLLGAQPRISTTHPYALCISSKKSSTLRIGIALLNMAKMTQQKLTLTSDVAGLQTTKQQVDDLAREKQALSSRVHGLKEAPCQLQRNKEPA